MWNRIRAFGFLALICAVGTPNQSAVAGHYRNVANAHLLLEHLVRHSDELLTEVNLTRANQFLIVDPVLAQIRRAGGWGAGIYQHLLFDPQGSRVPEYFIGKIVNDFRMQTIVLYDLWWKYRRPSPQLSAQFQRVDYEYRTAMAAVYFYIEALRRSYLVNGAVGRCWSQEVLTRRLIKLEQLAWEIRNVMMTIRYAALFRFPHPRFCLESTFYSYRINVKAGAPLPFVPFPYRHENRFWTVDAIQSVEPGAVKVEGYDADYWNQQWQGVDQSYLERYSPGPVADPGIGNRLPPRRNQVPPAVEPPAGNFPGGYQEPGIGNQPGVGYQPGIGNQRDVLPPVREPLRPRPYTPRTEVPPTADPGYGYGPQPATPADVEPTSDFDY